MRLFWSICFALSVSLVIGQEMKFYADVMVNAADPEHRKLAAKGFEDLFTASLAEKGSFERDYAELEWISIQYPADRSFRIISWQIKGAEGEYDYRSIYQSPEIMAMTGSQSSSTLEGDYDEVAFAEWAGGLVYKIFKQGDHYIAFTFRYLDEQTKLKTCEVINVLEEQVSLGFPLFQEEEGSTNYKNRIVLRYSADANATLALQEESSRIVYDNLIPVMGRMPGQGPTQVPDGSYKAYSLEGEKYKAIDKLFDQVMDTPPRAQRPTKGGKDLFGRSNGN